MSTLIGRAAFMIEEWTTLAVPVYWPTLPPYTAHLASRHGGTWQLHVHPTPDRTRWAWDTRFSGGGRAGRAGVASTHNFAKGQAEQAVADLDGSDVT